MNWLKSALICIIIIFPQSGVAFAGKTKKVHIKAKTKFYASPGKSDYLYTLKPGTACDLIDKQGSYLIIACAGKDEFKQVGFVKTPKSLDILAIK